MKIKLLAPHANFKAGAEWNCPWVGTARHLIEEGKALAVEPADLHLNPPGEQPAVPKKAKKTKKPASE